MRTVRGYAAVYNKRSQDIGFIETIAPGAFDGLIEKSDILATIEHNKSRGILARSTQRKGTLKLKTDSRGLSYEFESPQTALGEEALEGLRRGDIRSSSFAFTCDEGQVWEELSDGSYLRTITKFKSLHDISLVYDPAYPDATAELG
jgi:hypothetical protein